MKLFLYFAFMNVYRLYLLAALKVGIEFLGTTEDTIVTEIISQRTRLYLVTKIR